MRKACKNNILIPLCFIGVAITRLAMVLLSTLMILWITSFVDKGVLKNEDEAK
jgi:hypothetical protein